VFVRIGAGVAAVLLSRASPAGKAGEVNDYIPAPMRALRLPGLSFAVVHHGRVAKSRGA
jgi:hypothetical protein